MAPPLKPPLVAVKNGFESFGIVVVGATVKEAATAFVVSLGVFNFGSSIGEMIGAAFRACAL